MEHVLVEPESERKRDAQIPCWEFRNSSCVATLLLKFHKWMLKRLSYLFLLTLLFFVIGTFILLCG